jgi:hypothetical protein
LVGVEEWWCLVGDDEWGRVAVVLVVRVNRRVMRDHQLLDDVEDVPEGEAVPSAAS